MDPIIFEQKSEVSFIILIIGIILVCTIYLIYKIIHDKEYLSNIIIFIIIIAGSTFIYKVYSDSKKMDPITLYSDRIENTLSGTIALKDIKFIYITSDPDPRRIGNTFFVNTMNYLIAEIEDGGIEIAEDSSYDLENIKTTIEKELYKTKINQ